MQERSSATHSVRGSEILASAIALPLAFIRRVMLIPAALVDMMERHGVEK